MKLKNIFISLLVVLFFVGTSFGASVIVSPKFTAYDSTGAPLSGGLLYTYSCGTDTPKSTYTTYTGGTANANPVVLDTRGEGAVYASGCLKLVLKDSAETTIWTVDNIYSFDQTILQDADRDTLIQVEEAADEDTIRFDIAGTQKMYIDSDGVHIGTTVANAESLGRVERPRFSYKDEDELYIGPGAYHHSGTSAQFVYWNSTITFDVDADGSNTDNNGIDTAEVQYLYLDDSAIVTQASALLDKDCFLLVPTAPTYSTAKHGWYSGNDRCILALPTFDLEVDLPFFAHDGGRYVRFYEGMAHTSVYNDNITTTKVNVVLGASQYMPTFARKVMVSGTLEAKTADAVVSLYYRTDGQSTYGANLLATLERIGTDQTVSIPQQPVFVNDSLTFEVFMSRDGADVVTMYVNGYFLPQGM